MLALLLCHVGQLDRSGYRPTRIRPYLAGSSRKVAAVWTRDGSTWQWLDNVDADRLRTRDVELRREDRNKESEYLHLGAYGGFYILRA